MKTMTFVLGSLVGALAVSMWSRNAKPMSFGFFNSDSKDALKHIIQKSPDVQTEVNKIIEENHAPSM